MSSTPNSPPVPPKSVTESPHWADQTARRIVAQRGEKDEYVVASGITPSGAVHIGNFREVITVDLVARALRDLGRKVRFIYSWDSFDTFRKVPKGMPEPDLLTENLYRPIARVPDTRGDTESYAQYGIDQFEAELDAMGIKPDYLYQYQKYTSGTYTEQIRQALSERGKIRRILDKHRTSPLPESWVPTSLYCESCDRDKMAIQEWDGDKTYRYKCELCGHEGKVDLDTFHQIKLGWRVDWPMRWAYEKVDFEPGGKDHSSDGGSYDTAKDIVREVWGAEPPIYLQYDFVSIKGGPGKMSSSSGNVMVLSQVLEIYSPEMVRYIFAKQKPNTDFSIAFDEDVIKIHDEFDRLEAEVLQVPENPGKKWLMNRRVYELSTVDGRVPEKAPFRPGFRVLCNRLQICAGDIDRAQERYYEKDIVTEADRQSFQDRARRAWNWLERYAPDEFRYSLNTQKAEVPMSPEEAKGVSLLKELISGTDLDGIDPKDLNQAIYDQVIRPAGVEGKAFFKAVYQHLIGRDQGPRLPGFLKEIGKERLLTLL